MYRHLLIPTDGSELAERGVTSGLALAKSLGAKVSVIVVMEPFDRFRFTEMTGRPEESAKYAEAIKKDASRRKCGQAGRCLLRHDSSGEHTSLSSHCRCSPGQRLRPHRHVVAWAQRTLRDSDRQCDKQGAGTREKARISLSVNVRAAR